jgi:hypothetical protein
MGNTWKWAIVVALAGGVATACGGNDSGSGGSSGVGSAKYLDELTDNEVQQLCNWSVESQGGAGEYACGDGGSVTVNTVEECIQSLSVATVHCQVALAEGCVDSLGGDPCKMMSTQQCADYMTCVLGA